jgi:hypothetical protein
LRNGDSDITVRDAILLTVESYKAVIKFERLMQVGASSHYCEVEVLRCIWIGNGIAI